MSSVIELEDRYCAHNYHPLPVVLTRGEGVFVWDENGKKYLDMMSAYSAVSHGHANPRLVQALKDQADTLSIVSRAFYTDKLGPFLQRVCELTGQDMALPMNTGAEAVETAIKLAGRWGVEKKGVENGRQEIIVCEDNFHGRTSTIVSFSTDPEARVNYGPYAPGFKIIPYDDVAALEAAIGEDTVAFLVEPIQGEAGVAVPAEGYLTEVRRVCTEKGILMIADEVQTGLCRTGRKFACDHEGVPAARHEIIRDGVLMGYMHSLETAARMGVAPNGAARAQSHHYEPLVRMSNTFIEPGDATLEEMIADMKNGLLLKGGYWGYVFTARGQFTCNVENAYAIENGKIGRHYRNASFAGLTMETLSKVDAVGSEISFDLGGMCGKGGQSMPVDAGGPHMRIRDVVVGGQDAEKGPS